MVVCGTAGMAQAQSPEFKLQSHLKKKKELKKLFVSLSSGLVCFEAVVIEIGQLRGQF
jgi:hypothetical protein